MKWTVKIIASAIMLSLGLAALAQNPGGLNKDQILANGVASKLAGQNRFHKIKVEADDRIVTLTGTVDLYIDKVDAARKAEKSDGVDGVRNEIVVEGRSASDADLQEALTNKLRYDRIGYGLVFNSLAVDVTDGKATIRGKVRDYPDRNSAVAIAETTPGVRDVVDEITVAPASMFDDQLRIKLARAIYRHASLQKYAIDPQAPIRIVVENGKVELYGVVLNEMDRQIAFTQANSVPGVFGVTNHIVVPQ